MKEGLLKVGRKPWRPVIYLLSLAALATLTWAQNSIFDVQGSPSPNPAGNILNAVTAFTPADAWAVGFKNGNTLNQSRTLTLHWDGVSWNKVSSPNPGRCLEGNFGNTLNAVSAIASDDVWAVGFTFGCNNPLQTLAMHWNGTKWQVITTPAMTFGNNSLGGVLALAKDNVYAAGFRTASNGAILTLIEHWDGTSWTIVDSPNGSATGNSLMGISGTSPTDLWAVGDAVTFGSPIKTLVEHFDGATWTVVDSPNPLSGSSDQNVLVSVQALSPKNATAVGFVLDFGTQRELTMVQHWNGTKWKVVPSPNVDDRGGAFNTLRGVTALSAKNMYAVGFFANSDTAGQQETLVEHFDGTSWTIIPSPTKGMAQQLNGVFGLRGTTDVWSVGAWSKQGTNPEGGFLLLPKSLVLFSPIG